MRRTDAGPARRPPRTARRPRTLVGLLALVVAAALAPPVPAAAAPGATVAVVTSTLRQQQSPYAGLPIEVSLSGVSAHQVLRLELTTSRVTAHGLGEVALSAGQKRWAGRTPWAVARADMPVGSSWTLTASVLQATTVGRSTTYALVSSATRSGTVRAAEVPRVTASATTLTKNATRCSSVRWTVKVAGLDGSGTQTLSARLTRGSTSYGTSLARPVNGANTLTFPTCSAWPAVGKWRATVTVAVSGGPSARAAALLKVRTTPVPTITHVEGSRARSGKRTVDGYAAPLGDTAGLPVRLYYRAEGARSYRHVATVRLDRNGRFSYRTSAVFTGRVYAVMPASAYTAAARSATFVVRASDL
ncbi:hypothetical protein [Cellulomonas massiliensis]|uniref:hypothetical protein n=1 Tax=Cellulomonas massiliensis TaxID=1465811 RepID=UPI0011C8F813|nr:hypothetical protein [Cellulomonas massiliensis]